MKKNLLKGKDINRNIGAVNSLKLKFDYLIQILNNL